MKRLILALLTLCVIDVNATTNSHSSVFHSISNAIQILKWQVGEHELDAIKAEVLNFEMGFSSCSSYRDFIPVVTNNWASVLPNINQFSTNFTDRILIFGTGKQGDEELYLNYCSLLAQMKVANTISTDDFLWFFATTRHDLQTVLWRRYQEPVVSNLLVTLKTAVPALSNHWDRVLSGERYQIYLEEKEDGLWED